MPPSRLLFGLLQRGINVDNQSEADIAAKNLAEPGGAPTTWFTPEALAECDGLVKSLYPDHAQASDTAEDARRLVTLQDPPAQVLWAAEANPAWPGNFWFAFTGRGGQGQRDEL